MTDSMSHNSVQELFSLYRDGELPGESQSPFLAHLQSCAECQSALRSFDEALAAMRQLPPIQPSTDLTVGVRERIWRRSRGRFFSPRRATSAFSYQLASLGILLLLLVVFFVLRAFQPGYFDIH